MKQIDLAHLLTAFLKEYLPSQRNMSPNTIMAYRDAFTLLLRYCRDVKGIAPDRVNFEHLSAALVIDFLKYLENERHSKPCTRMPTDPGGPAQAPRTCRGWLPAHR